MKTKPIRLSTFLAVVLSFFATALASSALAQEPTPSTSPTPPTNAGDPISPTGASTDKRGSWVVAPIPISSETFGAGIVIGVGYIFKLNKNDTVSPLSTLGIATAFTGNGTRGVAGGGRLFFSENKYQTTFLVGRGRANLKFFGIGQTPNFPGIGVRVNLSGTVLFGEFMRNVGKKIFVGPRFQYRRIVTSLGGGQTSGGFEIPTLDLRSTTSALGIHVQRDSRDSPFYPRRGSVFNVTGDFFLKALGGRRNYQVYKVSYNGYRSVAKNQVLAYRGMGCSVSEPAPFYDLCLFNLRGYSIGQYQNYRMYAAEAEYRVELPWRMGIVGWGGVGAVARKWSKFRAQEMLPSGGFGFRFKLNKANHINYRIDYGFGRNGGSLSLSVMETF